MEVYILDGLLRRDSVFDIFESLIWTERFTAIGDFELVISSTPTNRSRFTPGTMIAQNESVRVMTIETVEDTTDDDGRKLLKIKGRSIESVLDDRVALGSAGPYNFTDIWYMGDTPDNLMRMMVGYVVSQGEVHPSDPIPFLDPNFTHTLFPADTIPSPSFEIIWEQKPMSLYNAIKGLADSYDLGFRLYRDPNVASKLYFNVYAGSDRTNMQTDLPPVVFSEELENLRNTKTLSSIEKVKNVAYVFHWLDEPILTEESTYIFSDYQIVYAPGANPDTEGFDRKAIYVEVSTIPEEVTDIPAYLDQVGLEELAKARPFSLLDGEIAQQSVYKYGVDYNLGDLVTMQNADGVMSEMRVTEQIFVHDREGERSYPTLVNLKFVAPGSWISWNYNKTWADMGATEYWNNQP